MPTPTIVSKTLAKQLTPNQSMRLGRAACAVWDAIGGDCLRARVDQGMTPIMPRSHVIEVVCDAGRLEEELRIHPDDADLVPLIKNMSYKELTKALLPFFPYSRYGF